MKKIFFSVSVAILCLITGCSSSRNQSAVNTLRNTVWVNFTPSELDGEKGVVIKSIQFLDNGQVFMKTGVGQGSDIVVKPTLTGYGTYTCSGSLKKGIQVKLSADVVSVGKECNYIGVVSPDGMILVRPDSTAYVYHQFELTDKKSEL